MLEMILDRRLLFGLVGAAAVIGIVSKAVVGISLKRLTKAAGNMGKSSHPLMRLVRAKFEHACMVSDKVQNVGVFVEKFLFEYRILGITLHRWKRLERASAWGCAVFGLLEAGLFYAADGMSDAVLRSGGIGLALGVGLFLLRALSDEEYRTEMVHTYMVDYLENVCAHRYEKMKGRPEMGMTDARSEEPETIGARRLETESAGARELESESASARKLASETLGEQAIEPEKSDAQELDFETRPQKSERKARRRFTGRRELPAEEMLDAAPAQRVDEDVFAGALDAFDELFEMDDAANAQHISEREREHILKEALRMEQRQPEPVKKAEPERQKEQPKKAEPARRSAVAKAAKQSESQTEKARPQKPKEVAIREILEEFLA